MFSIIYEPVHGIIYKNGKKEKRVMKHSEIHKFCDATLNRVLEGLKSYNNDVKYGYVQRELTNDEVEYLKLFEEEIEVRLKYRNQMRRWEMHVTGNKSFLTDYQEIDGGFVAFGGSPKGGKIAEKGKIRPGKLDFEDDEISGILKTFITGIENQINHKVKIIRYDNGTEFKNNDMNQFCGMKWIKREFSVTRTPQQNIVAEIKNMTLIEATRTMLADSLLPTTFWAEAVNSACYVQNRGTVTQLFQSMLAIQALKGKGLGQPSESQPTPPPAPPSHEVQVTTIASHPQKTHTPRRAKRGRDTEISQSNGPPKKVGDEAVYTGEDDRVVRAATTATSLEAE
ncbi:putative ribonuclease H-like domain-containing protein [Tanacetum coccineum]